MFFNFPNFLQISKFWPISKIFPDFQFFSKIFKCFPNFQIVSKFFSKGGLYHCKLLSGIKDIRVDYVISKHLSALILWFTKLMRQSRIIHDMIMLWTKTYKGRQICRGLCKPDNKLHITGPLFGFLFLFIFFLFFWGHFQSFWAPSG